MITSKSLLVIAAAGVVALGAYFALRPALQQQANATAQSGAFVVPALSAEAQEGERYYNAVCAACHGQNGQGTAQGPALVNDIYNPGHHGDEAFQSAARNGVQAHHWRFGNMPPQQVTGAEVARIVAYIRELQQANGIVTRPHNM